MEKNVLRKDHLLIRFKIHNVFAFLTLADENLGRHNFVVIMIMDLIIIISKNDLHNDLCICILIATFFIEEALK